MSINRRWLAGGAAAGLLIAGGGAAVAAGKLGSPKQENDAIVADAAKQLGVDPAKLSAALKKALENRVDAAVAAGRLTKAHGNALKARIEAGETPLFFGGRPHGFDHRFGHHGVFARGLAAAAKYIGVTPAQLRSELRSGKTLAQIANAHGRTAEGLVQALVDRAKKKVDAAVAAGRLTRVEADDVLAGLKDRITDLVNGRLPPPPERGFGFRGFRHHGPPPLFGP